MIGDFFDVCVLFCFWQDVLKHYVDCICFNVTYCVDDDVCYCDVYVIKTCACVNVNRMCIKRSVLLIMCECELFTFYVDDGWLDLETKCVRLIPKWGQIRGFVSDQFLYILARIGPKWDKSVEFSRPDSLYFGSVSQNVLNLV